MWCEQLVVPLCHLLHRTMSDRRIRQPSQIIDIARSLLLDADKSIAQELHPINDSECTPLHTTDYGFLWQLQHTSNNNNTRAQCRSLIPLPLHSVSTLAMTTSYLSTSEFRVMAIGTNGSTIDLDSHVQSVAKSAPLGNQPALSVLLLNHTGQFAKLLLVVSCGRPGWIRGELHMVECLRSVLMQVVGSSGRSCISAEDLKDGQASCVCGWNWERLLLGSFLCPLCTRGLCGTCGLKQ